MLDLDRPECRRLLAGTAVGRIAVSVTEFDNPVIRPVTYLFDTPSQSLHPRGWRDGDDARGPLSVPLPSRGRGRPAVRRTAEIAWDEFWSPGVACGLRRRPLVGDPVSDDGSLALTATDAECCEATPRVAAAHLMQQADEDPTAAGADRVPQRNGPTIRVDRLV